MQEKVDSLTERLERESVIGERGTVTEEADGVSTKGGMKTKCEFAHYVIHCLFQLAFYLFIFFIIHYFSYCLLLLFAVIVLKVRRVTF